MSIIKKVLDRYYYYLDSIKVNSLKVKIEHFLLNHNNESIIVVYRLGRKKLLNKMSIIQFEKEYFEKVPNYDQHRLTKFSLMQHLLQNLFCNSVCNKEKFIHFIEWQVKNEQLF